MPSAYSLDIYRGDTYRWQFRFWEDTSKANPVDLTNVAVRSEIRSKDTKETLLVTLACVVTLPNLVDVTLSAADSAKLTPGAASQWDLQLTHEDGTVRTPVSGSVKVQADATK